MKKIYILLISIISLPAFSQAVWRTKYFPVGTKWTELSLDTTKYDSWYSMVAGEWVPNYEQVDYYVEKDTAVVFYDLERPTTKVNRYREGKPDPLSYILIEYEDFNPRYNRNEEKVCISILEEKGHYPFPVTLNYFGCWTKGLGLSSTRLRSSVGMEKSTFIGTIQELGEDYFGGERKLTYAITDKGHMVIDGIGIIAWAGPECIFGPVEIGEVLGTSYPGESPYCTVLTHFERDGEVLYDVWPKPGNENSIKGLKGASSPSLQKEGIYDLQGRRLMKAPEKGLYIQDGQIKMIK